MKIIKSERAKKNDMFLKLSLIQMIIAVCIFGVIFAFAKSGNEAFGSIKESFKNAMSRDFSEEFSTGWAKGSEENTAQGLPAGVSFVRSEFEQLSALSYETPAFLPYENGEQAVMPVNGTVSSDYGYRVHPIDGGVSFHSGRDIAAAEGEDIYAALDGTVSRIGVGVSSGNYIRIEHENGLVTLYCHLSAVYASEGMRVRRGDIIGAVGHTGAATGPHLHFEVRVNGELVNPDLLLKDALNVY